MSPYRFALLLAAVSILRAADPPVVPDYAQAERARVPEALRWRLEDIYPSLEAWKADLRAGRSLLAGLEGLPTDWNASPSRVADVLETRERLERMATKLAGYASFNSVVQWSDPRFQNMAGEARQFQADVSGRLGGLESDLLKLPEERLSALGSVEGRLKPFLAYFRQLGRRKAHTLSAEAEGVLSQTQLFSGGPSLAASALRNLDSPEPEAVMPDGSRRVLDGPNYWKLARSADAGERKAADLGFRQAEKRFENTFAALLDTSVKQDLFRARVRSFPDCLSAELHPYEVDPSVYRNLIATVKGHLEPYHRFLRLRTKLLGLKELHPYDSQLRTVPGVSLRFTYDEARKLVQDATLPLGTEYAALVRRAFEERWIDVYGHKDKVNQGSASSLYGVHPYINLDYRGSFFDLITVAHELGHALSFTLAEHAQPWAASDLVWFVSEVPSTFNEILLMQHLIAREPDDRRKLALLSEFLERLGRLLFESVQQAELELAIHEHVEKGGTLSPAWLNARQLELERLYRGHDRGVMVVDDYAAGGWNHRNTFFAPFQSYFYAVGAVTSLALVDGARAGGDGAKRYLDLLKSGSSRPIQTVLKEAGVDLTTPRPIEAALGVFDRMVGEMETLEARGRR